MSSFINGLFYVLQILLYGPREANYHRIQKWILNCAEKQANALGTSIKRFREENFNPQKLQEATGLTYDQINDYSINSKIDKSSILVMQKLVSQYSLSSGMGKPGSQIWSPHLMAVALVGLNVTKQEQNWRFLLFSALCELMRSIVAENTDSRISLDAAYIVMLYSHLGPNSKAAHRFVNGFKDDLILVRFQEAEEHLIKTLPWR